MATLCVLSADLRNVPQHRFDTDVCDKCHSSKGVQGSNRVDTINHPGHKAGTCSETLWGFKRLLIKDYLII